VVVVIGATFLLARPLDEAGIKAIRVDVFAD
jgi:hypothetical protein